MSKIVLALCLCLVAVEAMNDGFSGDESSEVPDYGHPYHFAPQYGGNQLGCPYSKKPEQCDCGFVIVEKKHHYCVPGKSVIKVLRKKGNCQVVEPHGVENFQEEPSKDSNKQPAQSQGRQRISRMLRTLLSDNTPDSHAVIGTGKF